MTFTSTFMSLVLAVSLLFALVKQYLNLINPTSLLNCSSYQKDKEVMFCLDTLEESGVHCSWVMHANFWMKTQDRVKIEVECDSKEYRGHGRNWYQMWTLHKHTPNWWKTSIHRCSVFPRQRREKLSFLSLFIPPAFLISMWDYFPLDFITHSSVFSLFKSTNN